MGEWVKAKCITIRDCKGFMSQDDYEVALQLEEGICSGNNVDGEDDGVRDDDENDLRDDEADADGDVNSIIGDHVAQESKTVDIHREMVENILEKDEKKDSKSVYEEDWRDWISPPRSPRSEVGSE